MPTSVRPFPGLLVHIQLKSALYKLREEHIVGRGAFPSPTVCEQGNRMRVCCWQPPYHHEGRQPNGKRKNQVLQEVAELNFRAYLSLNLLGEIIHFLTGSARAEFSVTQQKFCILIQNIKNFQEIWPQCFGALLCCMQLVCAWSVCGVIQCYQLLHGWQTEEGQECVGKEAG